MLATSRSLGVISSAGWVGRLGERRGGIVLSDDAGGGLRSDRRRRAGTHRGSATRLAPRPI